jgi:DNA-binding NarL/FixJ family response regulator
MTRVLVVDQFLIRAGLVGLLGAAPGFEVAGEAGDGEEAVRLAAKTRPDVILMDIRMPGMNGIQATRRIIADAAGPAPRVLVLTTFDLDECVYGALRAGASGFLLKDSGPERLLAAVAAVGGGDALFTSRRMPDRTDPRPMPNPRQASTR